MGAEEEDVGRQHGAQPGGDCDQDGREEDSANPDGQDFEGKKVIFMLMALIVKAVKVKEDLDTTTVKPMPTPRTTVGKSSAEYRLRIVYEQLAANLGFSS